MHDNTPLLYRYGDRLNTHDLLKIVAISLMVVDHIGQYVLTDNLWLRLIGRGAAPLFFFLIGYVGKLRLHLSLFIYAIILSTITIVELNHFWINILFNFILIQFLFWYLLPTQLSLLHRAGGFIICIALNFMIYPYFEYGTFGILIAYSANLMAHKDKTGSGWMALSLLAYMSWQIYFFRFYVNPYLVTAGALLAIALFIYMYFYRLKTISCPKILLIPSLFVSRYSLEVYFYHLIILQTVVFFTFKYFR